MEDRHTVIPNFSIKGADPSLPRQVRVLCAVLYFLCTSWDMAVHEAVHTHRK